MTSAGALRERVRFEQRAEDANGERLGGWVDEFTVPAEILYLRGGDPVMAQRLQGVQPVIIRVRFEARTQAVTSAWRAVDARSRQIFEFTNTPPSVDRAWIEMLATGKSGDLTSG